MGFRPVAGHASACWVGRGHAQQVKYSRSAPGVLATEIEVHAYVLMGNHYHLIIRSPGANASQLNVSNSPWFNAKRQRVGHVFHGRFRSTLIAGEGGWLLE